MDSTSSIVTTGVRRVDSDTKLFSMIKLEEVMEWKKRIPQSESDTVTTESSKSSVDESRGSSSDAASHEPSVGTSPSKTTSMEANGKVTSEEDESDGGRSDESSDVLSFISAPGTGR